MTKSRATRIPMWLIVAAVLIIAMGSAWGVIAMRRHAYQAREEQVLLAQLETSVNHSARLEWQAVAQGRMSPEISKDMREARIHFDRTLDQFRRLHEEPRRVERIRRTDPAYLSATREEMRLLAAGNREEASKVDEERVDPNFNVLKKLLARTAADHSREAERDIVLADVGSVATTILALAMIGLLLWRFDQARRTAGAETAAAERSALARSEEHFRSLVQYSSDVTLILDVDGTVRYASPSVEGVLGRTQDGLTGTRVPPLTHPDDIEGMQRWLQRCASRSKSTGTIEFRFRHADDSWRRLEAVGTNRLDDPAVNGIVVNARDVTDRRQAEAQVERNLYMQFALNSILRLAVEDIPLGRFLQRALDVVLSVPGIAVESRGSVFVVDKDSRQLAMTAQKGLAAQIRDSCATVPFGTCLCGRAAATNRTQFADHVDERHDTTYDGISPHGHYCAPILRSGRALGVLNVYVKEGHGRDPVEESFLAAACDAIAGAMIRREVETSLRRERDLVGRIVDTSPASIMSISRDTIVTFANERAQRMFGLTPAGIAERRHSVRDWRSTDYDGNTLADEDRPLNRVLATGEPQFNVPLAIEHPDGRRVLLSINAAPDLDDTGQVQGIIATARDVTEQVEAEETVRNTERALRTISRCNDALIHATDESDLLNTISDLVVDVGGYLLASVDLSESPRRIDRAVAAVANDQSKVDVITLAWANITDGRGPAEECMSTGKPCVVRNVQAGAGLDQREDKATRYDCASSVTLPIVTDDLLLGTFSVYSAAHHSFEGEEVLLLRELAGDLGYGITSLHTRAARGRAEAALRDSEERYRRLVENSPEPIAVQSESKVVFVNPAGARLLGAKSPDQILGRPFLDFVHPDDREAAKQRATQTGGPHQALPPLEGRALRLDDVVIDVEAAGIPLTYKGKPAVQFVFRDITERKRLEQIKSDFLSMVSHELRTPLAVILGNTNVIEQLSKLPPDPAALAGAAGKIRDRVVLMTRLVDDLLQITSLSAGTATVELRTSDMPELIESAVRSVPLTKNHILKIDIPSRLPSLRCDPAQVSMAVANLVSNAVKFSPEGGEVAVSARRKANNIRISVTDQGVGVSSYDVPHIFDRFFQADMSATRAFGGTGVGLYITHRIVEAHGGRVEVSSEPGKGSTFTIQMPVRRRAA